MKNAVLPARSPLPQFARFLLAGFLCLCAFAAGAAEQKGEPTKSTRGGVDLILLVDTSASMVGKAGGKNIFPEVKRVLKEWVATTQIGDHVLLVTYDSAVKARPTAQILGDPDKDAISREIDSLEAKGLNTYTAAALRHGLAEAARLDDAQMATGKKNTKVVILLTDGINDPPKDIRGTDAEVKLSQVAMQYKDKPWFVWQVQLGSEPDAEVKGAFVGAGYQHFAPISSAPGKLNDVREKIQAEVIAEKAKEVAPTPPSPPTEIKPQPQVKPAPVQDSGYGSWLLALGGMILLAVIGLLVRTVLMKPKPHGVLQIVGSDGTSHELDFDAKGKSSYRLGALGSDLELGLPQGDGIAVVARRQAGQVLCIVSPVGQSEIRMKGEARVEIELFDQDEFLLADYSLRYTGNTGPRVD